MMRGPCPRRHRSGLGDNWDPSDHGAIDQYIEARVAERARQEAVRWRLRLVVIETAMMALLIVTAGFALGQKPEMVLRSAVLVGVGCLVTGVLVIALSAAAARLLSRIRQWRKR